jgi:sugar O-acyltransferase (sialic acid O-acetyltransferase NeuD family)
LKPVVIFGTGDFARIASVYLSHDSPYKIAAFTVNEEYMSEGEKLLGHDVVPFERIQELYPPDKYAMFVAIGFSKVNQARASVFEKCDEMGYELISYINSKATHWGEIEVGRNTFIFEENVIQPFVSIGDNVVVWSGNHIGHDSKIGNHCFIASHAVISGNCTIGDYCFVGVNATFRDAVTVAPRCVIGAGAIVMKNTKEGDVLATRHTEPFPRKSWELKGF